MLRILERDFQHFAEWKKPEGGLYIWLKINPKVDMRKIFTHCTQHGVLINPGYMYDKENQDGVRLSFAYAGLSEIQKGLEALRDAIVDQQ